MPEQPAPRLRWFRLLRRLGFRWAFPIGTLAVPYHPVVVLLLPWVVPALVIWGAVSGDVPAWALFLPAAVLGVLLSVPVLVYVLMVFRVPLLQGWLVAGGMLLIGVDVVAGRTSAAWSLLPAAYVAGFVVQSVGGSVALRRQRTRNVGAFVVDPSGGVVAEGPERFRAAEWLLEGSATSRVSVDETSWMRVEPSLLARAHDLASQVQVGFSTDGEVLKAPGVQPTTVTVRTHRPQPSWLRLLSGEGLVAWEVDDGDRRQRLLSGRAEVVGRVPVFVCFYFVAVFGGRSRWVVGFARRGVGDLGDGREVLLRAFPPRTDPPSYADPAKPLATLEAAVARRRQRFLDALDGLEHTTDEQLARAPVTDLYVVSGQAVSGAGARLCDLVDRAKQNRAPVLAEAAARALARIPPEEFRALAPRILPTIAGSRILSLQWKITPDLDVAPLPRGLPRFGDWGGFGLLAKAPDLYARLGELDDPDVLVVVEALAAEAGWVPALERARDEYLRRHPRG